MNSLFSTAHLCGYVLFFTLFLLLLTGGKGLLDLTSGKQRPEHSTVTCLLLCLSLIVLIDLFLFISGLILGKGHAVWQLCLAWSGLFIASLLYFWSKTFITEKDKIDATLTFPAWILCFASTGIGVCARTLFLN